MNRQMQALQFAQTGSLDALQLRDVRIPEPATGEVRVKIHAAGINPSDIKNVLGRFPYTTLPRIPGRDFAGVVVDGPAEWKNKAVWGSGKGVGFTRDGSHAEYMTIAISALSLKPAALSFAQAASCGVPYITALDAIDRMQVKKNTRLLIIGNGAVATAALALARSRDANIVMAVRKPQVQSTLQAQDCQSLLLTEENALAASVHTFFPQGAEAIFDTTGAWLSAAVSALAFHGCIAVIAAPASGQINFPVLDFYRRGGTLVGVNSLLHDVGTCASMLDELRVAFDEKKLPAPATIRECSLSEGKSIYAAIDAGDSHKYVFVF
jgi:NADPH:quinone reductase-like Zn-dependent oxidoreductase